MLAHGERVDRATNAQQRAGPAAGVLRGERGVPLPGTLVRGVVVPAGGRPGRRLAANRQRRGRLRRVAPPVAALSSTFSQPANDVARAGRRPGVHERLLLPGNRALATGNGRRHRVSGAGGARGTWRAHASKYGGAGTGGHGRVPADGRAARRGAARIRVRFRQLRAVRPVRGARARHRRRRRRYWSGSARRLDAHRAGGHHTDGTGWGAARRSAIRRCSRPALALACARR